MLILGQLGWLLLSLLLLAVLQRRLHIEIQSVLWLLSRHVEIAALLFFVLFLPGILVHEISHYLCARLLGVKTGRLSLFPKPLPNGKLRLGFVETAPTDLIRDVLIGTAPLLVGMTLIAYLAMRPLGMPAFLEFGSSKFWEVEVKFFLPLLWGELVRLPQRSDLWLWLYLIFVISSTMLPSASDRRAWLPIAVVIGLVIACAWLMGAGPWLIKTWERVTPWISAIFRVLGLIFGISAMIHALLLPPFWVMHRLLRRVSRSNVLGMTV